ncbi:DEKNAAC104220 [Brettanomyces naardenensis]|uniref:DEKNAAC104220 n=1 Tax=Brettanomyces naardenensis TaxID=13370 RepID=A0A448YPX8_BRENA|nr:DEKNAAC104220 [Brettanomyces naardenensis]
MPRIQQLDPRFQGLLYGSLSIQSVEDVARELIQNSVDAGAREIVLTIEIDRFAECVNVICHDDGDGVACDDMESIGRPHCSSRIGAVDKFGYRGDALDSIIQVSSVCRIVSRRSEGSYETVFSGGERRGHSMIRSADGSGTSVYVYDIFGRIGVRKAELFSNKDSIYLRNIQRMISEMRRIAFYSLAGHPLVDLRVNIAENGRHERAIIQVSRRSAADSLLDGTVKLMQQIYGKKVIPKHDVFSAESDGIAVEMAVGRSLVQTKGLQFILVNGRPSLDRDLRHRIDRSFETQSTPETPPGKPVYVIFASCKADLLDIVQCNRFWQSDEIGKMIHEILSSRRVRKEVGNQNSDINNDYLRLPQSNLATLSPFFNDISEFRISKGMLAGEDVFKVVGQADKKFIIVRVRVERPVLIAVDQHACDERINVERIYQEFIESTIFSGDLSEDSRLTEPIEMDMNEEEMGQMTIFRDTLKLWGIGYEISTKRITHMPQLIINGDKREAIEYGIKKYLDELWRGKKLRVENMKSKEWWNYIGQMPELWKAIISKKSCRMSVKFGEELERSKCENMLAKLIICRDPFHCAHGRPSIYPICELGSMKTV